MKLREQNAVNQRKVLDIDPDAALVVHLNQVEMSITIMDRERGDHAPNDWVNGGRLMTAHDVFNAVEAKKEAAAAKKLEPKDHISNAVGH